MTDPIKGYPELTAVEVALINEIKEAERKLGEQLAALAETFGHRDQGRWLSLAKTHLETGFMYAVKAIARPTGSLGSDT